MHAYHTDSELICAYRKGNERAFETLLNRYQQGVFLKINFVVRNEEIANDLFQDVWIKVVQILKSGRYVEDCLLYTSPSPRDLSTSRMPSSA